MQNIKPRNRKNKLALIIPAHNEELVIMHTIKSALAAGQKKQHIYVVDDNSSDKTSELAKKCLPPENVLKVHRSGKAKAIKKAVRHFRIISRYQWIHIADADGVFDRNYFRVFKTKLDKDNYVAATGYIQSLKGNWVSLYRAYEYTFGLEIIRRVQHFLKVIPVIPGPTSCFRADIFGKLDFETGNLTEDFDITIQIHRKRIGQIQYIPEAKTLTQDPQNFRDYFNQVTRWNRGFFQGVKQYKIGLRGQRIDWYLGYLMLEMMVYYFQVLIILPLLAFSQNIGAMLALTFLLDFIVFFSLVIMAAIINKRIEIVQAFPTFYILRLANMYSYLKAFVEIMILRKYRVATVGWSTQGRRYKIS